MAKPRRTGENRRNRPGRLLPFRAESGCPMRFRSGLSGPGRLQARRSPEGGEFGINARNAASSSSACPARESPVHHGGKASQPPRPLPQPDAVPASLQPGFRPCRFRAGFPARGTGERGRRIRPRRRPAKDDPGTRREERRSCGTPTPPRRIPAEAPDQPRMFAWISNVPLTPCSNRFSRRGRNALRSADSFRRLGQRAVSPLSGRHFRLRAIPGAVVHSGSLHLLPHLGGAFPRGR